MANRIAEPPKTSLNESGGNKINKLEAVVRALLTKLANDAGASDLDYQDLLDSIKS